MAAKSFAKKNIFLAGQKIDKKILFSVLTLFGYAIFWITISVVTLAFGNMLLNNGSLFYIAQICALIALVLSSFFIFAAILVWRLRLLGAVIALFLIVITISCNIALLVIGIGIIPFSLANATFLPVTFIALGAFGILIDLLLSSLLASSWDNFLN